MTTEGVKQWTQAHACALSLPLLCSSPPLPNSAFQTQQPSQNTDSGFLSAGQLSSPSFRMAQCPLTVPSRDTLSSQKAGLSLLVLSSLAHASPAGQPGSHCQGVMFLLRAKYWLLTGQILHLLKHRHTNSTYKDTNL